MGRRHAAQAPIATRSFDAAYYRKFYGERATRVADAASARRLGDFVCAYLRFLGVEVRDVLDLGCGLGRWRNAIARNFPRARYTGVETSDYLCRRLGWHKGSVVDYDHGRTADLVICQGVLQYLDAAAARAAIANLARSTHGALYLEVLTTADWQQNCDRTKTDGNVHLRTGAFYRRHLRPHFVACGGGVFAQRRAGLTLFELERWG